MARYLAIDWNPPQLHVLAVDSAKGHARAVQAFAVALGEDLTPASAEKLGKKLRDALKAANIAPAPVLWTIPRDKVVLKDVTIPPAPANEEPAVVRFQVAKESTEPMADTVIDYTYASPPQPNQPRKILAVVVRKSLTQALGVLSAAAGLKLKAITPRAFAASGLLGRKGPATETQAILLPTTGGAEFLVFRKTDLAWARTFPSAADLTSQVRRTLLVLAGQNPDAGAVTRVLAPTSLKLDMLPVPVEPLDPWLPGDTKPEPAEAYLAPLGLAEAEASRKTLPINLAAPKEPTASVDTGKRNKAAILIGAAVLIPILFVLGFVKLSQQRGEIQQLAEAKEEKDDLWKKLEQSRADVEGLKEWEQTTISWIDELYDVAARFPHVQGLRLTQVFAAPIPRKTSGAAKDKESKYVGLVTLHGTMKADQDKLLFKFTQELRKDTHLRVGTPDFHGAEPNIEFTVKVEVAAQPGSAYKTRLEVPPQPKRTEPPIEPAAGANELPETASNGTAPAAPTAPGTPNAAKTSEPDPEDEP